MPAGLWFVTLRSKALRLGPTTVVTSGVFSSTFTWVVYAPSTTFDGVISSQTLKLWSKPRTSALKHHLRWAGYALRMEDHRLPKIALYGELSTGHIERWALKKRYKDCLKNSLTVCHVDLRCLSDIAADRVAWRHSIFKALNEFEEGRRDEQKGKRYKGLSRAALGNTSDVTFTWGHCSRPCLSRIGPVISERACRRHGHTC